MCVGKGHQKMIKKHDLFRPPNPRFLEDKGVMFFNHFWVPFSKPLCPKIHGFGGIKGSCFLIIFWFQISSAKIDFWSIFDRFLIDFGRFLEAPMCLGKGIVFFDQILE